MNTDITRVLAPNPSLHTGPGTNTWLVSVGDDLVIVDPGPPIDSHAEAIVAAVAGRPVTGIVVTHTHSDHAPLANPLASDLGTEVLGFAPGPDFEPDRLLADGDTVGGLVTVHTPGHTPDHVCFLADDILFTGDHIMGGSTVMMEDLATYLESLRRLETMTLRRLHPGHGPIMDDPAAVIEHYITHRLERERQIVDAIASGCGTLGEVVQLVYAEVDSSLHPLAVNSVGAHVRKLVDDGAVHLDKTGDPWNDIVTLI